MKKEKSGFLSLALGLVIVALGVSLAEYTVFNNYGRAINSESQTASVPNQNQDQGIPAQVAGWKIYQDNQYGFSLQYPFDFSMKEDPGQSVSFVVPIKNYFSTVVTGEVNITIPNPSAPLAMGCKSDDPASGPMSKVGMFTKTPYMDVGAGQLYEGASYILLRNNLCYSIKFYIHSANGGAAMFYNDQTQIAATDAQQKIDKANFMALVDRTVSTFRFTK